MTFEVVNAAVSEGGASWSEWIAVVIALVAVATSVWSAWFTVKKTRETSHEAIVAAEESARSANYTRIHEILVEPVAASGRRQLFLAAASGTFPGRGDDTWDQINYSLALYDTLGAYVIEGLVDPDLVLRAWHHPLTNIAGPVRAFMQHRASEGISQPWSFLIDLLDRAEQYPCTCPRTNLAGTPAPTDRAAATPEPPMSATPADAVSAR
ncbi:hypothetical protein [Antribacter gilvus]|uniref:hypothetical protein n=1 Tax=Antribacter gilvus TaxID=2304675 RepID=UPI000F79E9FD|nr:hypothetical protein [Antribacter gilvus]